MTLLDHIRALYEASVTPASLGLGMDMDASPTDAAIAAGYSKATIDEMIAGAADAEVIAAYTHTDGEPGDWAADALAAEIQRRNLSV